jgi:ATP-dependent DNA ligase
MRAGTELRGVQPALCCCSRMGLENIVAKWRDSRYRSGRTPDWIKIKNPDAPTATSVIER